MTSKVDICNMALGLLGNFGTVNNIDTPVTTQEKTFALWYDKCRQMVLKLMMPNFALGRDVTAQSSTTPAFGYSYNYAYPSQALKLLGVGNTKDKVNDYAVETDSTGVQVVMVNELYPDGLNCRFIRDVTDTNKFSIEFVMTFAEYLAAFTCVAITQDGDKAGKLFAALTTEITMASGLNAQENLPIRINRSKYKMARRWNVPTLSDKE